MKFLKTKAKFFYPLLLLVFYILVRPQFRELAQLVSNQVGQALSYFWTLLFLEAGYLMLVFSLVKKYSPRTVFQWAKKKQFLPAIYATIFSSCAIYWLDYFLSGFTKGRLAIYHSFPVNLEAIGSLILFILVVVIRPMTVELIFRGALVQTYFKNWPLYASVWGPALVYGGIQLFYHPFTIMSFLIYTIPSLFFGLLNEKTGSLYYPILAHIGLNFIYSLPLILSIIQHLFS